MLLFGINYLFSKISPELGRFNFRWYDVLKENSKEKKWMD